LGEDGFKDDRHVLFEGVAHLATRFIEFIDDSNGDRKTGLGGRLLQQSDYGRQGIAQDALTRPRPMAKEAAFDRVELRAIGRIMRHTEGDAQRIDEALKVCFEQVLATTVTATAVAQEEER
jgi:hypothetical protein